jgi:hypothetical protein
MDLERWASFQQGSDWFLNQSFVFIETRDERLNLSAYTARTLKRSLHQVEWRLPWLFVDFRNGVGQARLGSSQ